MGLRITDQAGLQCPFCGYTALAVITPTQAVCGTDDCPCLTWNPRASVADNRRNVGIIEVCEQEEEIG